MIKNCHPGPGGIAIPNEELSSRAEPGAREANASGLESLPLSEAEGDLALHASAPDVARTSPLAKGDQFNLTL